MPESEVPTSGEPSDAAVANAINAVAASVYGIAQTIAATELEFARNPCARQSRLLTDLLAVDAKVDNLIAGVEFWAAANQSAVDRAIANWGYGTPVSAGGIAFGTYLANQNYVVLPPFREMMPSGPGDREPSSRNVGTWISPGVYLKNGRLQGSRLVDAWYEWRARMRTTVYAIRTGRPNWRARLHSWVGTSQPGNWRKWVAGDPIAEDSKVGRAIARKGLIQQAYDEARVACQANQSAQRAAATGLAGLMAPGADTGAPQVQTNGGGDERGPGLPPPLIVVGLGVAVAVFVGMRR